MVTTHLGKYVEKRKNNIRSKIFDYMMGDGLLLNTEVFFYFLVDDLGIDREIATELAMSIHGGGRKVTSKGLEGELANTSYELEQRQITIFIKRYMKSSRIEVIKEEPYIWQMNGFSRLEAPYVSGFERRTIEKVVSEKEDMRTELEKVEQIIILYKEKFDGLLPDVVQERNRLKEEISNLIQEISSRMVGV